MGCELWLSIFGALCEERLSCVQEVDVGYLIKPFLKLVNRAASAKVQGE